MEIRKIFTQVYEAQDCEGKYWDWVDTKKNYNKVKNNLGGYITGVRMVEKIFNAETFEITIKELKRAMITWEKWEKKVVETISEE